MTKKKCPSCNHVLPATSFYRNRARLDGLSVKCWECHNAENKRTRLTLRAQIFAKLGGKCVRCGFNDPRALQVDHVNGGGLADRRLATNPGRYARRILADETGAYQLLCANDNWIKVYENKEHRHRFRDRVLGDAVPVKDVAPPGVNAKKWWASLTGNERAELTRKQLANRGPIVHTVESKAKIGANTRAAWASKTSEEREAIIRRRVASRPPAKPRPPKSNLSRSVERKGWWASLSTDQRAEITRRQQAGKRRKRKSK